MHSLNQALAVIWPILAYVFIWWILRLVNTLRVRMDSIETKLDQLLVIQQAKSTAVKPASAEQP
ncbi:hypothetical protein EI77_03891 [Prosthecobacter fusiformis]|uniref:Uncharacterized protein n=1 Tax=Prosthecobacter fusiformis TaxID=48464 RepID=A0A4R7RLJ5_9BACT|nr:hypothetical protein EI77_03891 [Prosthecobacter fusiformis]